jgi:hypothetical protein
MKSGRALYLRNRQSSAVFALAVALVFAATGCTDRAPDGDQDTSRVDAQNLYQTGHPDPGEKASGYATEGAAIVLADDVPVGEDGVTVPNAYEALYAPTREQQHVIDTAEYALVKQCMARDGFEYLDPAPTLSPPPAPSSLRFDSRLGVLDPGYAQQFGYQLDPALLEPDSNSYHDMPSREYEMSYHTCREEAPSVLAAGLPDDDDLGDAGKVLAKIEQDALAAVEENPEYQAAREAWSQCMAERGFDYASPQAAVERYVGFSITSDYLPGVPSSLPTPSAEEKATALADIECKRSSQVYNVWRRSFWDYQAEAEAANRPALQVVRQETTVEVENAQRVLAELGVEPSAAGDE